MHLCYQVLLIPHRPCLFLFTCLTHYTWAMTLSHPCSKRAVEYQKLTLAPFLPPQLFTISLAAGGYFLQPLMLQGKGGQILA